MPCVRSYGERSQTLQDPRTRDLTGPLIGLILVCHAAESAAATLRLDEERNVLRRLESWQFQRRWLQRDAGRYCAQGDELEADTTICDNIAVLAELTACTVLDTWSLCMLCAERSLE